MPGKRKREEETKSGTQTPNSGRSDGKPMSAIAAAKLRANGSQNVVNSNEADKTPAIVLSEPIGSDYEESEPEEEKVTIKRNYKLCNWQNTTENIISDTRSKLVINLEKHSTIALIGSYSLKVLKGAVHVNGGNISTHTSEGLTNRVDDVFVPSTHPITKVRGLEKSSQVQLSHLDSGLNSSFRTISPLLANIWNSSSSDRSFDIIRESDADALQRPLTPEMAPEDWLRAVDDCAGSPSTTFITGPSHTGKSTFARRLLNRYLTGFGKTSPAIPSVFYLDLDPNKPEYTPPGQISLVQVREINLGPCFTHPSTIPGAIRENEFIRGHPLPVASSADQEEYYLSCIEDLLQTYITLQQRGPKLPLLINTPPSLYTAHFDGLLQLIPRIKPQHVIHLCNAQSIDPDTAAKLDTLQTTCSKSHSTLHELSAQTPLSTPPRSDSDLRAMHMQSYFHLAKSAKHNPRPWTWDPTPLSHLTPWELSYSETPSTVSHFTGFLMLNEPVEPSHLLTALNGTIIQIVDSTSSRITQAYNTNTLPRTPKSFLPYFPKDNATGMVQPLDARTSKLVCTALIRGFDPVRRVVQLLVPRTHDVLLYGLVAERTVLVGGCCDVPEWAYLEDAYANGEAGGDVPWVERRDAMLGLGHLGTVRRVRKFQQGERGEDGRF